MPAKHFKKPTDEELKQLQKFDNALNPYANLKSGDAKDWEFNAAAVEEITDNFGKDKMQFKVYDPEMDAEFLWQVSHKWARMVTPYLLKGKTFLHVERHGESQTETEYRVYPVGEDPEWQKKSALKSSITMHKKTSLYQARAANFV